MIRPLVLLLVVGLTSTGVSAGTGSADTLSHQHLRDRLNRLVDEFGGDAGIYFSQFNSGVEIAINADSVFPTASMIKVPILTAVFHRLEQGDITLSDELVYRDSLLYPGSDILGSFRDGESIELGRVVMLMMTMSDNTASLWLQHLVGTGTYVNEWLAANEFMHTRVNSRTEGRQEIWKQYGWGQTTPREMARLLTMIRNGEAVSEEADRRMYRFMTRNYWAGEALSAIPPWVQAASKNGSVSRSKSEVVMVNAPSGDYVFCVITNNQNDAGYREDNEGFMLIREVSRILWDAFGAERPD